MKRLKLVERIQHEIVLAGGLVVTVGEVLAAALPHGPVQTGVRVALPVVVTVVQRARTLPVAAVEALVKRIERRHAGK